MLLGSTIGILIGGGIFISNYRHLLIMLIALEMMALSALWLVGQWMGLGGGEEFLILLFLSLAACEGSLGLAILVALVRSHGSDSFSGASVLMC